MVVAGILALALALPTGALFGIGYGTGVRIGYEQIYPLLFPADAKGNRSTTSTVKNVKAINQIYNAIGGKEASQMGIAVGLSSAMSELDKNPDFQDLLKLESTLSGLTTSNSNLRNRYGLDNISQSGDSYSDAQLLVQEKTDERIENYQNEYDKAKFRLAMENLSDIKFVDFYNRRASIYNSWQQQIMVLLNRIRFPPKETTPTGKPEPKIQTYKGTSLTTITFTYKNYSKASTTTSSRGTTSGQSVITSKTQVYRFDVNGHIRKARSIKSSARRLMNAKNPIGDTYMSMYTNYSYAIKKAYPQWKNKSI